ARQVPQRIESFNTAKSLIYTKSTEKRSKTYNLKQIVFSMILQDNLLIIHKSLQSPSLYDVLAEILNIPKEELYHCHIERLSFGFSG
ncbi:MAG: hypothetical protein PHQ41_11395, partial [Candidatus Cloacimonetes bacterium]|nr:hypothetical protein [Candidatus Cloacimonadota bacterium]